MVVGVPIKVVLLVDRDYLEVPVEVVHSLAQDGQPGLGLAIHDLGLQGERSLQEQLEQLSC